MSLNSGMRAPRNDVLASVRCAELHALFVIFPAGFRDRLDTTLSLVGHLHLLDVFLVERQFHCLRIMQDYACLSRGLKPCLSRGSLFPWQEYYTCAARLKAINSGSELPESPQHPALSPFSPRSRASQPLLIHDAAHPYFRRPRHLRHLRSRRSSTSG